MCVLNSVWAVRRASEARPASLGVLRAQVSWGTDGRWFFCIHTGAVGWLSVQHTTHPLKGSSLRSLFLFGLSSTSSPPSLVPLEKCTAQEREPR